VLLNHIKNTYLRSFAPPFLFTLGGIILDYESTTIGLSIGFIETHPQYHPVWALLYFWGAMVVFTLLIPKRKICKFSLYGFTLFSYLGVLNNILVILGLFPGL
jgi:hypothetical protein